ncbi:hypothetical protein GALMADRAFT_242087 [Galerina marginata CBS 339.88]|uniref:Uncharacterized protein n=1 Tax=Galerina marginata (strain CBS 339.88) TaxID=685588 RepID=A0A067TA18_GALM3|nr:hypothetical protein GALMADRAFT_242087 [Galerina marginata CBS 339.88]
MSATTTPTPPVASELPKSQSPAPAMRPSTAIQQGADLLFELVEHEKAKLAKLYHHSVKALDAGLKAKHELELQPLKNQVHAQEKQIQGLYAELQQAQSRTTVVELELEKLRVEHESLKASLDGVGIVYVDQCLRYNEETTRIVGEFVKGARIQQKALMSSRISSSIAVSSPEDDPLLKPVGPMEFFGVLSGVLEKSRKFAEDLEKRRREVKSPTTKVSTEAVRCPQPLPAVRVSPNLRPPLTPAVLQPRPESNHSDSLATSSRHSVCETANSLTPTSIVTYQTAKYDMIHPPAHLGHFSWIFFWIRRFDYRFCFI